MADPLLSLRDVKAWYGPSQALHGASLDLHEGELLTLLGRNGAGKSTLLKSIMGMMDKRQGSIRFKGKELMGLSPHHIGRLGVAFCPDDRGIFASLTRTGITRFFCASAGAVAAGVAHAVPSHCTKFASRRSPAPWLFSG